MPFSMQSVKPNFKYGVGRQEVRWHVLSTLYKVAGADRGSLQNRGHTMTIALLQQALEALNNMTGAQSNPARRDFPTIHDFGKAQRAADAIRAHLASPVPEREPDWWLIKYKSEVLGMPCAIAFRHNAVEDYRHIDPAPPAPKEPE